MINSCGSGLANDRCGKNSNDRPCSCQTLPIPQHNKRDAERIVEAKYGELGLDEKTRSKLEKFHERYDGVEDFVHEFINKLPCIKHCLKAKIFN
jgi:hypothetical protein